jgi:di/tripeptidase
MPSTYTANSGIQLPANGEQSGTWGETVNDNMGIIDRLTNGVGAISLSGTTHTLTVTDGTLSEGQYNVLVLGGTPSGTNTITITPNDGQHVYIVKNSSGQSAIFTQGSGGNITLLNGETKVIYSDGVGAGSAVVDITNDFAMGNVTITGGAISGATLSTSSFTLGGIAITATGTEINYVDGVTSAVQTQLDAKVIKTADTGSAVIPTGTEAERDGSPVAGYLRFNSDATSFEGYNGTDWGSIGGGATEDAIYENSDTIAVDITIGSTRRGMSTGPISVAGGVTVTVNAGGRWVVI